MVQFGGQKKMSDYLRIDSKLVRNRRVMSLRISCRVTGRPSLASKVYAFARIGATGGTRGGVGGIRRAGDEQFDARAAPA